MPAEKKDRKAPVTDSEGLRVSTVHDETAPAETLNAGAREAFEAEVAAEAPAAPDADEETQKVSEFEKFLADR